MQKKIAEIAGDEKSHNDVQWTYSSAVRTLYTPATFFKTDPSSKEEDTKENKIQKSSFCSKFTVEVIKAASTNEEIPDTIFWDYYPHLRSTAIPKTLEAFLYQNSQLYDYLIYVGKKPYEELKKVIQAILIEIKGKNSADYTPVIESYEKLLQQNAQNHSKNKLEKCFYLIKNMQPVFAGTSRNIYSNYEGVFLNMIRRLAFFPRDFSKQITIDTIPIPFETKSLETKIEIQPLDKFEEKYNINEDNEDQEKIERSPLLSQIPISDSDDRAEFKKDTGIQLITDQDITIQKICKDREYYLQQEHKYEELIYQKIKILIKIGQKIEELDCRINSCLLFSKISKKILINKCDLLKNIYRELEKLAEGHITFEIIAKNIKKWEKFQDLNTFCYFFGTRSDYSMFSSKRETQTLNRVKEVTDFIRRNNM